MSSLSISAAWDETRPILLREGKLLAAVALALIVLPQTVLAVIGAPVGPQSSGPSMIAYFIVILLGCAAQIALNRLAIGPSVTVGSAIGTGFRRLLSVAAVVVLAAIAVVALAVVLLLILTSARLMSVPSPGQAPPASLLLMLIVMVALVFAMFVLVFPLAAVETGNPLRLIARAWALSRHNYLRLLGFVVIIFVGLSLIVVVTVTGLGSVILLALGKPEPGSLSALLLGIISGVVQASFTVVTAVMIARIYVQLAGRGGAHASVPNSGI
jgi:hypothetical protein